MITAETLQTYRKALGMASDMMRIFDALEPTSALKQAGSDCGIAYGDEMRDFVEWARKRMTHV